MEITPEAITRQPPEAQAIILCLREQNAELEVANAKLEARVEELERQLGQTPENSSLPPSTQHPHAKPPVKRNKKSKKKRGGQFGHRKHKRALVPVEQVDDTVPCLPVSCRGCGERLSGTDPAPLRHQVWELPEIKPQITEYQQHRLSCACCGVSTCGTLPEGVSESQAGPRLTAFAAIFMSCFRQSKRQTALFFQSILNVPCSPGWLVKLQQKTTARLRVVYDELRQALADQPRLGIDESPTKEQSRKAWMWVFVASKFTVFRIRPTRKRKELEATLGTSFRGIANCDRARMYWSLPQLQWCWAHLKRDFQALADSNHATPRELGEQLLECAAVVFRQFARSRDGTISRAGLKSSLGAVRKNMDRLLLRGLQSEHARTAGFCRELYWYRQRLWTFLEQPGVEPTNNHSERALRTAVICRKLSFGTQSHAGSRFVETMLTIIETCRQQAKNVLNYITQAITARKPKPLLNDL